MEVERKQMGGISWKMTENAARDRTKWRKLLSGPYAPTIGCEEGK